MSKFNQGTGMHLYSDSGRKGFFFSFMTLEQNHHNKKKDWLLKSIFLLSRLHIFSWPVNIF
jgi:hypothetical protein